MKISEEDPVTLGRALLVIGIVITVFVVAIPCIIDARYSVARSVVDVQKKLRGQ